MRTMGQTDKSGQPYILHPLRVMARGETVEQKVAGVLHDVVEDTPVTLDDLKILGIPHHIVDVIDCVSRRSKEVRGKVVKEQYQKEFIERICKNPIAIAVKLNDIADNTDPNRAIGFGKDRDGMMERYSIARARLIQAQLGFIAGKLTN
jgi:(p)ppGpp synthase/HD superfamily hydrolase